MADKDDIKIYCDMRPVKRRTDCICYPMQQACLSVPKETCQALRLAYDFARYDMIELQFGMCMKALNEGWKDFGTMYTRLEGEFPKDGEQE